MKVNHSQRANQSRVHPSRAMAALPNWGLWFGAFFAIIMAMAALTTARAETDPQAEAFINDVAAEAVAILQDKSIPSEERTDQFAGLVVENADMKSIGYFTLGKYRRTASEAELAEFSELFEQFAHNFYADRLADYSSEELTVTGSLVRSAKDVIVTSELAVENSGDPVAVNWRLRKSNGGYSLRDLEVLGVWIAIEQRSQFTSIIAQNGGTVSALNEVLREKVESGEGLSTGN